MQMYVWTSGPVSGANVNVGKVVTLPITSVVRVGRRPEGSVASSLRYHLCVACWFWLFVLF